MSFVDIYRNRPTHNGDFHAMMRSMNTTKHTLFFIRSNDFSTSSTVQFLLTVYLHIFHNFKVTFDQLSPPCLLSVYTEIDRFIMVIFTHIP